MDKTAYSLGLQAGGEYWKNGMTQHKWVYPDKSPYPEGSSEEDDWWTGFHHATDDLENAYYS